MATHSTLLYGAACCEAPSMGTVTSTEALRQQADIDLITSRSRRRKPQGRGHQAAAWTHSAPQEARQHPALSVQCFAALPLSPVQAVLARPSDKVCLMPDCEAGKTVTDVASEVTSCA